MTQLTLLGTILFIHLLAVISPGPDFIMCVKNSLQYSRKTGIYTAIGFAGGIAVHITYCVFGLALLISKSILIFNSIKILGAAYLIYIGIKSLSSKHSKIEIHNQEKKADVGALQAIKIGFLTNVLNPKATLFFLGLFTIVITPETPNYILGIASTIMIFNTFLWFALVATFFTQKHVRQVFDRFQGIFNKFFGGLLILLRVKIALSQK